VDKRAKVTRLVLEHVERADDAVKNFRDNVVSAEGVLTHPPLQAAALKVAHEELQKAIALIERTKWISMTELSLVDGAGCLRGDDAQIFAMTWRQRASIRSTW
jgi:hypothetical protein